MKLSNIETTIVCLEQALRNSKEHLQRCIRRRQEAQEAEYEAQQSIKKAERSLATLREAYLARIASVDEYA